MLSLHLHSIVLDGQRPELEDIQGPEHFTKFARTWVKKCWDGDPEQRPTFAGEIVDSVFSGCTVVVITVLVGLPAGQYVGVSFTHWPNNRLYAPQRQHVASVLP